MGRDLSWEQRIGWSGQVDQDPPREPLPAGRTRRGCDVLRPEPQYLPWRPLQADSVTTWPDEANVAIQHSMLTAIWHMGRDGTLYDDPGADFFTRLHPERAKNRALHQLETMGYHVTLDRVG